MTTPPSPDPPDAGRSFRPKPDRQARDRSSTWRDRSSSWRDRLSIWRDRSSAWRDHLSTGGGHSTWRDQPRGLACAVIAAFALLTAAAFVFAVVAVVSAMR